MPAERQCEIEIFVLKPSGARLLEWLAETVGPAGSPLDGGDSAIYPTLAGLLVVTPAVGGTDFTSLWFNTPRTPWATDLECARAAARALRCVVRCAPPQEPGAPRAQSDLFVEIDGEVERLVEWSERQSDTSCSESSSR